MSRGSETVSSDNPGRLRTEAVTMHLRPAGSDVGEELVGFIQVHAAPPVQVCDAHSRGASQARRAVHVHPERRAMLLESRCIGMQMPDVQSGLESMNRRGCNQHPTAMRRHRCDVLISGRRIFFGYYAGSCIALDMNSALLAGVHGVGDDLHGRRHDLPQAVRVKIHCLPRRTFAVRSAACAAIQSHPALARDHSASPLLQQQPGRRYQCSTTPD